MNDGQHYEKLAESLEKLSEVIYDIRDRLIRVEERQNRMTAIEKRADEALEIAVDARSKADDNAKDIDQMTNTAKWMIGILATGFFTESAAIIGLFAIILK